MSIVTVRSPLRDAVAEGIDFLDEQIPGWDEAVDADTLDLGHECMCVLGQLRRTFNDACLEFRLSFADVCRYGFYVDPDAPAGAWEALTAEWRDAIRERQA